MYEPRVWKDGDAPKAADFNRIEKGIEDADIAAIAESNAVNSYIDSEFTKYMPLDGSKPMIGNLNVSGENIGVQLKNTKILLRTAARPEAITLEVPSGGNIYANGSPVWPKHNPVYALYFYSPRDIAGSYGYANIGYPSGYDCNDNEVIGADGRRTRITDTGTYMITVAFSIIPDYISPGTSFYFECGSQRSPACPVYNGPPATNSVSYTWITPSQVPAGSLMGLYVDGTLDMWSFEMVILKVS